MHPSRTLLISASLSAILLAGSCQRRPDNVLSESKTVDILSDLQLAEAYIDANSSEFQAPGARQALELSVLSKHGVTQKQFDATLDWYGHNMDQYSKLYQKVAKNLDKAKNKGGGSSNETPADAASLWPYGRLLTISRLGNSDGISFSINSGITKGDQLEWHMHLSKPSPVEALLGVEYADGAYSMTRRSLGGSERVNLKLQCDSTREIKRVFGLLRATNKINLPLWADSISLTTTKFSADSYYIFNSQQNLLPPGQNRRKKLSAATSPGSAPSSADNSQDGKRTADSEGINSSSSTQPGGVPLSAGAVPSSVQGFGRPGGAAPIKERVRK